MNKMSIKIIQDFIPKGRKNRPGYPMTPKYITIHETGSFGKGANAKAHAKYIKSDDAANRPASWHFTVDDTEIYQHLPLNENGWHAGDGGSGTGNRQSIGIEICVNSDGNFEKAVQNAQWLVRKLMAEFNIPIENIKQHYDWSGKNCPYTIRKTPNGWKNFLDGLKDKPKEDNTSKVLYRVQTGAFKVKSNADKLAAELKKKGFDTYIVQADGLFKVQVGAYSIKANADAMAAKLKAAGYDTYITTKGGTPAEQTSPTQTIKVGSKVKVKKGAKTYTGGNLANFVYNNVYDVIQINGDRVVIGKGTAVTAAVHKNDLILQ